MTKLGLVSSSVLVVLSGCATTNPLREAAASGDLMTFKVSPMPAPADLEGVWLDSGGTALLWVKVVDGEYRFFAQDSMIYGETDPNVLMAAMDNGKVARELATDWPYPRGSTSDPKGRLSNTFTGKLAPSADGKPTTVSGTWAFAHSCRGEGLMAAGHLSGVTSMKTDKGLQLLTVRLWNEPLKDAKPGDVDPNLVFQRTWQFAKMKEEMKKSMAQELADTKNFCRQY